MVIEGDIFYKFTRAEMYERIIFPDLFGHRMTHFSPDGNLLDRLGQLFCDHGESETGQMWLYLHSEEAAAAYPDLSRGAFTLWEPIAPNSDLLFYEGLHGSLITENFNIAQHVAPLVGVAPTMNLEWIQKIVCDSVERGYSHTDVESTSLYAARPTMLLIFHLNFLVQTLIFNTHLSLIQLILLMCKKYQHYMKA